MSGKNKRSKIGLDATIVVALIGLMVALLNSTAIQTWWNNQLNATPIPVPSVNTATLTTTLPTEPSTELLTVSPASLFTETPLPIDTAIPTAALGEMKAQLIYNYATGKAPLQVTFNAHSSYLSHPDGTTENCEFSNVCTYSWEVRQGSSPIAGPEENGGTFAYTFQKRGTYTVVAYVCRGGICNFAAANIDVK